METLILVLIAVVVIGVLFYLYFKKNPVRFQEQEPFEYPIEDDIDDDVKPTKPPKV